MLFRSGASDDTARDFAPLPGDPPIKDPPELTHRGALPPIFGIQRRGPHSGDLRSADGDRGHTKRETRSTLGQPHTVLTLLALPAAKAPQKPPGRRRKPDGTATQNTSEQA